MEYRYFLKGSYCPWWEATEPGGRGTFELSNASLAFQFLCLHLKIGRYFRKPKGKWNEKISLFWGKNNF